MAKQSDKLITRKEAAEILTTSEKTVQRLTSSGKLSVTYQKRTSGGQEALYKTSEVKKARKILDKGTELPVIVEKPGKIMPAKKARTTSTKRTRSTSAAEKRVNIMEASVKLILTLAEACALTNLSRDFLIEELKAGHLRGIIRGQGWKIHRAHLEDWVLHLYVPKKDRQMKNI